MDAPELDRRVAELRERMRPVEDELTGLRGQRDLLLTELRRRRRAADRTARADLKSAMREGKFPSIAELVAAAEAGSLGGFAYNPKTGGPVRRGSPGRPGVRVHFPGPRQERLVPAEEVYARPGERDQG